MERLFIWLLDSAESGSIGVEDAWISAIMPVDGFDVEY